MQDIIRRGDLIAASAWEYLGTVAQDGETFLALCPLDDAGGVCFFRCDADGCRRVDDADAARALAWRFSQLEMEAVQSRLRKAR